jgi:hypothetical protein
MSTMGDYKAAEALELVSRATTSSQEARRLAQMSMPTSKTYVRRAEECRGLAKSYLELATEYDQLAREEWRGLERLNRSSGLSNRKDQRGHS